MINVPFRWMGFFLLGRVGLFLTFHAFSYYLEMSKKEIDVVSVLGNGVLQFHEPKQKVDLTKYLDNQLFHFDYSFDEDATNELIYR